ncbi:MAG TPA: protein rep, partial [Thermoanaerobacterales bacterium]|nr:protein rep [Thermoanaerobacterales bacterium]
MSNDALVKKELINSVLDNIEFNKIIVEYYRRLLEEHRVQGSLYYQTLINKIRSIKLCNKFWVLDKYELQKVKDLKSQNLCHDKFCSNCKKVKQAGRMAKYIPELQRYDGNLYHLVLTTPNCSGQDLKENIKKVNRAFRQLIRYLRGTIKIKGIDFSSWGYRGAVRSLEVSYNDVNYHPHLHVGIILDQNLLSKKNVENIYSFDFRKGFPELTRLFSEEEILIQKIWRLLIDGEKVTLKNVSKLEVGYSCILDKFQEGDYNELFKYLTKGYSQGNGILSYEQFKTLYEALYRLKQIQGYGRLYRIDDNLDIEEFDRIYNEFIESLKEKENPAEVLERPQEILEDNDYKLISRKSYFNYLRE